MPVTPVVATDVVIELADRSGRPIVFVRRRNPPPGWALPGGFVDLGESVEEAARREMREETGLDVRLRTLLGVYSAPGRDPRGHCVSVVYVGEACGEPQAGDDAGALLVCDAERPPPDLAFDHAQIVQDYRRYLASGIPPAPAGEGFRRGA